MALGLTTTLTDCVLAHPSKLSVKVYGTVMGEVVVLVSVSLMVAVVPEAAAALMPVMVGRVQEKFVLAVRLVAV